MILWQPFEAVLSGQHLWGSIFGAVLMGHRFWGSAFEAALLGQCFPGSAFAAALSGPLLHLPGHFFFSHCVFFNAKPSCCAF